MKTLDVWVAECEDQVLQERMRKEIINNKVDVDKEYGRLSDAVVGFLDWNATEDGQAFWNDMYVHAMMNE